MVLVIVGVACLVVGWLGGNGSLGKLVDAVKAKL